MIRECCQVLSMFLIYSCKLFTFTYLHTNLLFR
jgi:hypothetical protein